MEENEVDSKDNDNDSLEEEISRLIKEQYLFTESIYAYLPVGIEIYDANGVLRSINDHALRMYGVKDQAMVVGIVNLFNSPYVDDLLEARIRSGKEKIDLEFEYDFDRINSDEYFSSSNKNTIIYDAQIVAIKVKGEHYRTYIADKRCNSSKRRRISYGRDQEEPGNGYGCRQYVVLGV